MTRRATRNLAIIAVALLALWFFGGRILGFRNWEWHQKLVLEVDTPTGTVIGGSVVAVHFSTAPKWVPISGGGAHTKIDGEASFVEISPGRFLFAVRHDAQKDAGRALSTFFSKSDLIEMTGVQLADAQEAKRETRVVARDLYPELVTFDNISDPMSVKEVDPDNLAATFGPGVSLKRLTLEMTGESMNDGQIEKVLPWLPRYRAIRLDGSTHTISSAKNRVANELTYGSFKTP